MTVSGPIDRESLEMWDELAEERECLVAERDDCRAALSKAETPEHRARLQSRIDESDRYIERIQGILGDHTPSWRTE